MTNATSSILTTYDCTAKRYLPISADDAKVLPKGTAVVELFWSEAHHRHFTVPGASLYYADGNGGLVLDTE